MHLSCPVVRYSGLGGASRIVTPTVSPGCATNDLSKTIGTSWIVPSAWTLCRPGAIGTCRGMFSRATGSPSMLTSRSAASRGRTNVTRGASGPRSRESDDGVVVAVTVADSSSAAAGSGVDALSAGGCRASSRSDCASCRTSLPPLISGMLASGSSRKALAKRFVASSSCASCTETRPRAIQICARVAALHRARPQRWSAPTSFFCAPAKSARAYSRAKTR